jgi:Mrp family chromosome partitioning ATPase
MSAIQNPAAEPRFMLHDSSTGGSNKPMSLTVRAKQGESRLVFASDPGGFVAEQYRVIRRRLVEQYPQGASILITSPGSGDGKTVTATNLAWCLAEAGMPTLLAEMDLRNPSIDKLLGCNLEGAGIESVLEEGVEPRAVLRQVNRMQFYLATARRPFENPVDLLTSSLLRNFLAWAKENHKWVVLDSPPLLTISDSIELSAATDCTLLVVRARVTPRILVERSIELLGPRLNQVIMNDGTVCADSSHRYFSTSYPYGSKNKKKRY